MLENTEQVMPGGNIVMNDLAENNVKVDDADDFYYEEPAQIDAQQIVVPNIELPIVDETAQTANFEQAESMLNDNTKEVANTDVFIEPVKENFEEIIDTVQPIQSNFKLSDAELNKMVEEEENNDKELDDSYALSNFDVVFDSLYSDVAGANNFISNLIEQKKNVNVNEANLMDLQTKLEKERQEFAKYIELQKKNIDLEKAQCNEFVKNQHIRLQNEENQFNSDCEATRAQLKLEEEKIKISNEKLENEKSQFENSRQIEEEKMKTDRANFEVEKEQFVKEKEIALEKIKQGQKELQTQIEQFNKTKELEEKKLELESKNLSQSCARFKELVSQFNSGFQQLPTDKD